MFPGDSRSETMNTSQLFMVFGRTSPHQSASHNNQNKPTKQKDRREPLERLTSVFNLLYGIGRDQIRKEYSLEFSFTEM